MTEKPQILTRVTDFLLYLIPQIAKFPKNQRYNLGERIETTMLNVFEKIIEALYINHRILLGLIKRKVACRNTLWLIEKILESHCMMAGSLHQSIQ